MMKVALVTGGARGIGAAISKRLASDGYVVAVNYYRDREAALQLIAEIEKCGDIAIGFHSDIGSSGSTERLFNEIHAKMGLVDILVNNAGVSHVSPLRDMLQKDLENIFDTNFLGAYWASKLAVHDMREKGGGSIVNITSEAARGGGNNMTAYASSKAALNTLTVGLAREVAGFGIRVNAVSPGVIDTEMTKDFTNFGSLPMGRKGEPREVANVVSWLCSPEASYVSGAIIPVSGAR